MEDLRTIALSAFIRESASQIGYENVKPKQIEAVMEFCKGKDKTNPFLMSLAFRSPSAQTVESTYFYPASAFCIRSKREGAPSSSAARDASASAMSHLAIIPLINIFIAFLW